MKNKNLCLNCGSCDGPNIIISCDERNKLSNEEYFNLCRHNIIEFANICDERNELSNEPKYNRQALISSHNGHNTILEMNISRSNDYVDDKNETHLIDVLHKMIYKNNQTIVLVGNSLKSANMMLNELASMYKLLPCEIFGSVDITEKYDYSIKTNNGNDILFTVPHFFNINDYNRRKEYDYIYFSSSINMVDVEQATKYLSKIKSKQIFFSVENQFKCVLEIYKDDNTFIKTRNYPYDHKIN